MVLLYSPPDVFRRRIERTLEARREDEESGLYELVLD